MPGKFQKANFLLFIISIQVFFCLAETGAAAREEKWECESPNNGMPQHLEITLKDGKLESFDYLSSVSSPDGDTMFNCSFTAKRGSNDSIWSEKGVKTVVEFTESGNPKDKTIIKYDQGIYTFIFKMSPTNCGHSTPFASEISISKAKKECFSIIINS